MPLSRRELIAALLGAPSLLAGCSSAVTLPPAGELFGQSATVGHRLRDGYKPRPAADQWRDIDVVIVGGGVAGLSAAWQLQKSGVADYVVLELEEVTGGTSRSGVTGKNVYPWGAHYVPVPFAENQSLIQLLSEMGVVETTASDGAPIIGEQFLCREPEERLFFDGAWIEGLYPTTGATSDDLAQLSAFRKEIDQWVAWRDAQGRRAFAIPISQATDDPHVLALDRLSMSNWMDQHGWTSPRLRWVVDYSCRDDYGLTADQTSAWAGVLYFAARQTQSGAESQEVITWPEGNGHIVQWLAEQAGECVKTGAAVTQISPGVGDQQPVEVVWFDTKTQAVAGYRAQRVIFAAPQFMAPRLIDQFTQLAGRQTSDFQYGSWLVANLHLKERPRERDYPLSWDNVIHGSRSLGYVVSTHQSGQDHGPTVLTWYYPYCDPHPREIRERLLTATWSDLADLVLSDLERPHPDIRRLTSRLDIFRWGHAMIQPRPGFVTSQSRQQASRPAGRIHFANTDLSGIALFEEAFDHGFRAAREVVAGLLL